MKRQLYKVTIGDLSICTCIDFVSMKASALGNGKKKWIYYKHLYFILQQFLGATIKNKFVYCPTWTFSKAKMLLNIVEVINPIDWIGLNSYLTNYGQNVQLWTFGVTVVTFTCVIL
jgi:hypothetical protein